MKTTVEQAVDLYKTKLAFTQLDSAWIDIETLKDWLWTCDCRHGSHCHQALIPDDTVETRPQWLVDVRKRCLVPADLDAQYAALSYVWGNVSVTQTNTSNLHTFLEEGSLSSPKLNLSKTIRHTIELLDLLGIRFLWVDALCIVQNDSEIKQKQIHAMAWIYANAYVTIVAADGWDAEYGLRGIRGVTEPRSLSADTAGSLDRSIKERTARWYKRGWTYQEMIFSRRTIMFHYHTVLWDCPRASWNETFLNSVFKICQRPVQPTISFWPNIRQYMEVVRDYSTRQFTAPEEALIGISSLLSVWKQSYARGFVSGLPQMFFLEALLWQPKEPMNRRQTSANESALGSERHVPTWSWAAWEGAIDIKSWESHFSHLHILPHPREDRYIWQVKPTVKWHYTDSVGEMRSIILSSLAYRPQLLSTYRVPKAWELSNHSISHSRRHRLSYTCSQLDGSESRYPIPLFCNSGAVVSANILYGRTRRGLFRSDWTRPARRCFSTLCDQINLLDKLGKVVGALVMNTASFHMQARWYTGMAQKHIQQPVDDRPFDLIEIAEGSVMGEQTVSCWGEFGFELTEMPEVPKALRDEEKEIVYVMWVKWHDGIAYRHGLGRVLKSAWRRDATEEVDILLG